MASRQSSGQGFRDAATILPVIATLLLTPPLIWIFATTAKPGGIPLIVLYIFVVWAAIILVALFLARRVDQPPNEPKDQSGADERG
ncbi:hypothetical protein KUG47_08670 [Falsochrobactrum sp. TDYN1]|uniref:Uncharacterized protein n=1 Tax=Falsochrobactrum tianjinense TaxID=2706015 RepID=A0A949PRI7_9HYPH|nr:hypothetical protein [Falsochrobactrum sp. TDYN1]MBV2143570.1 hypothetical protein [Falsochrobactrum sp. TDYN1]